MLNDKTILITGGTGSFGKKFTKEYWNSTILKKLLYIQEMNTSNI